MYRAFGLLQPGSNFSLNEAAARLNAQFADANVTQTAGQISVVMGEWEIALQLNSDPVVREQSIEFAEKIAGLEDGVGLESCDRRVEVGSETPDPFVEHLGDFHTVLEVLRTFSGIILIDPGEPALL